MRTFACMDMYKPINVRLYIFIHTLTQGCTRVVLKNIHIIYYSTSCLFFFFLLLLQLVYVCTLYFKREILT